MSAVIQDSPQEKLQRLQLRAKTDHIWLANECLGLDFQENPHAGLFACYLPKDPDKGLFELDTVKKNRLILWPRKHYKTTAAAVEMVSLILNYPNIRILILSGNLKESKKRLKEVRTYFETGGHNGKLRQLFPEFCAPEGKRFKSEFSKPEEFFSPARTKLHLREATVSVSSPKALKTGNAYDVVFIDDLVNEQNYRSKEQLQKAIEDYKSCIPLREPEGYIIVNGTRHSFDDCYGWIQEQIEKEGLDHWLVSVRTCWISRCTHCDHSDIRHFDGGGACSIADCKCTKFNSNGVKEVLFPQAKAADGRTVGFTEQILENIRREEGDEFFACQYLNNPLAGTAATFTRELLYSKVVPNWKIPQKGPKVIMIDLAHSTNANADETVMVVARIAQGRLYVIDCVGGHLNSNEKIYHIFRLAYEHRPQVIYIEKSNGVEDLKTAIDGYATIHNFNYLPIEILPFSNKNDAKAERIATVQPILMQDRLYFMAELPNWDKIEQQFLLFPKKQRHEDYADAIAMLVQAPTGFENEPLPQSNTLPWFMRPQQAMEEPEREANGLPYGING